MVYEVKIYKQKWISKSEMRGNVFIHKSYKRWVCISKEILSTKAEALREIRLCLSMDKEDNTFGEFKYSIRVLKKAR